MVHSTTANPGRNGMHRPIQEAIGTIGRIHQKAAPMSTMPHDDQTNSQTVVKRNPKAREQTGLCSEGFTSLISCSTSSEEKSKGSRHRKSGMFKENGGGRYGIHSIRRQSKKRLSIQFLTVFDGHMIIW